MHARYMHARLRNLVITSGSLGIIASLLAGSAALASSSATVTATATAQKISVAVSTGTVTYGTLALGASLSTLASPGLADQQTATNDGNVAEDLTIEGTNSTDWTLDSSNATAEHYIHKFCIATCGTDGTPTNFTALTTSPASLVSNVAANGTQTFDLRLTMPTSTTHYSSETVSVIVMAAAH